MGAQLRAVGAITGIAVDTSSGEAGSARYYTKANSPYPHFLVTCPVHQASHDPTQNERMRGDSPLAQEK